MKIQHDQMKYQNGKGAVCALLAEYEQAITALQNVVTDITDEDLIKIVDPNTESPECRSIQTILTHVVSSGFSYCIYIRNFKNKPDTRPLPVLHTSAAEYVQHLDKIMDFTAETFAGLEDSELERYEDKDKIHTRWGQVYDFEQIMEHAIVHILRHRRQIEGFKRILNKGR